MKGNGQRILVVEDDQDLAKNITFVLERLGYDVTLAKNGKEALAKLEHTEFDLIWLDSMMPEMDGHGVIKQIRSDENNVPIIMVTCLDQEEDIVKALDAGADDYIRKPFGTDEIAARLRALLRRSLNVNINGENGLGYGDLFLSRDNFELRCGKQIAKLTPREYELLHHLMNKPGKVVSQSRIVEGIWNDSFEIGSNVVEVHIKNIRAKLQNLNSKVQIENQRGFGYILKD